MSAREIHLMLRSFGSIIVFMMSLCVAGCGDPNPGLLYADFRYATRCEETLGCPGAVEHDICGYNLSDPCYEGMPSPTLSCSVTEMEGATRTINFSAQQGGGFSIRVEGLVVPFNGGSGGGAGCRVSVVEGNNRYEGRCGGAEPSMEQPCQITNVAFRDDLGNPTITGEIFCQYLPNEASRSLRIEVTNIGMGPGPASTPATFRFANCSGLTCTPETCIPDTGS